jgi:hypothetical protein
MLKKKNYTNAELINMSAANFMKLSPKTRERAKVLRAAAKNKGKAKANQVAKKPQMKLNFVLPNKGKKRVPVALLKTAKFNKLVAKIYENKGGLVGGSNFNNAWSKARQAAINLVESRLAANKPAFSPSPIPKPKAKSPSPRLRLPSPLSPLKSPKPKKTKFNYKLSPKSGRAKIKAPNSGRYVYANGSTISLEYLKSVAAMMGVNIKGLRSKADIANKLFSK